MTLLSDCEIHELIDEGRIDTYYYTVTESSIPVHLGDEIYIEDCTSAKTIDIDAGDSPDLTRIKIGEQGVLIPPGQQFTIGILESFHLPDNIHTSFTPRPSLRDCFLSTEWNDKEQTLVLKNTLTSQSVLIKSNMYIGDIGLYR